MLRSGHPRPSPPNPESRIPNPDRGTSLIEALIAVGLIAGALVSVAELAAQAVRSLAASRDRSVAVLMATQKVEELLALPAQPGQSPGGTLDSDTPGFVEYLDARGRVVGLDADVEGTVFARRWTVLPLSVTGGVLLIEVRAGRCVRAGAVGGHCVALTNESQLASARREAW